MNTKTETLIKEMKTQTIGVEVEMYDINRSNRGRLFRYRAV